jgi:hypothetical protein
MPNTKSTCVSLCRYMRTIQNITSLTDSKCTMLFRKQPRMNMLNITLQANLTYRCQLS